jgi:hypothetical protein
VVLGSLCCCVADDAGPEAAAAAAAHVEEAVGLGVDTLSLAFRPASGAAGAGLEAESPGGRGRGRKAGERRQCAVDDHARDYVCACVRV